MDIGHIHEILNNHLVIIPVEGKEGTLKVILQEDLGSIAMEIFNELDKENK